MVTTAVVSLEISDAKVGVSFIRFVYIAKGKVQIHKSKCQPTSLGFNVATSYSFGVDSFRAATSTNPLPQVTSKYAHQDP